MLIFAVFTLGYFVGVITALTVFSPRTKEIEEQEIDALKPILQMHQEKPDNDFKPASILISENL